jgi:hypothetical protein
MIGRSPSCSCPKAPLIVEGWHMLPPIWFDPALIVLCSRHVNELMTFPGRVQRYRSDLTRSSGNGCKRDYICLGSSRPLMAAGSRPTSHMICHPVTYSLTSTNSFTCHFRRPLSPMPPAVTSSGMWWSTTTEASQLSRCSHFVYAHSEYHRWYVVTHRKWSTVECEEPSWCLPSLQLQSNCLGERLISLFTKNKTFISLMFVVYLWSNKREGNITQEIKCRYYHLILHQVI